MQEAFTTLVYDDSASAEGVTLSPLTDLRASFLVRTGAMTTLERLRVDPRLRVVGVMVPESRAPLTREQCDLPVNDPVAAAGGASSVLLVNGRCAVPPERAHTLEQGGVLVEARSGHVIAARVWACEVASFLGGPRESMRADVCDEPVLLSRPWHVRSFRDRALAHDLSLLVARLMREGTRGPAPAQVMGDRPLAIHASAVVCPGVVFDCAHGAIAIDEHVTIRPGAVLIGPCSVGPHSTVLERATIRPGTAIGPHCKVNGEVGGTIFQGCSNKAHDGYVGDSYLGEWVNLGAGTTTSNLLNTYASTIARATAGGRHEHTGEQFLGAIIGDHVKTAICTRIMTASVLGTGCMFACTAPVSGTIAPFSWVTDAGSKPYRGEKFLEVMRAAMQRRHVQASGAYVARVQELMQRTERC